MAIHREDDPRWVLTRAGRWLLGLGAIFTLAGIIALIVVLADSNGLHRFLFVIGVLIGWLVPGVIYLICGYAIPRRRRWAVLYADLTTYVQMFFAGAMVVVALLHIKAMWPMLLVSLVWLVPLLVTPIFTEPCPHAMDLIAQLPTLGYLNESERAK